jgi:hypothetical protein
MDLVIRYDRAFGYSTRAYLALVDDHGDTVAQIRVSELYDALEHERHEHEKE